jgi:hypothetical protein
LNLLKKFAILTLSFSAIAVFTASPAQADVLENLVFSGTATCTLAHCAPFGSGPITGSYTLDLTTNTIVGPWSFSTPFATLSSADPGAATLVGLVMGNVGATFVEDTPTFEEGVTIFFPGNDPKQLGALSQTIESVGCSSLSGMEACIFDYRISAGTNAPAVTGTPEPSSLTLAAVGVLALLALRLKKV